MNTCNFQVISEGICLVTFSFNYDHQNAVFSMFEALRSNLHVETVTPLGLNSNYAKHFSSNHYVACPARPGICKGSFNLFNLINAVLAIKRSGCRVIYFESVHLWNLFVMFALRPNHYFVQTIHDVIPHDNSKAVYLCQRALSALSNKVVIKSRCFIDEAKRIYKLSEDKINAIEVWRSYPLYSPKPLQGGFLFFGRIRRYKGLEAIEQIVDKTKDISYLLVGEPDRDSLEIAERLASYDNVSATLRSVSDDELNNAFLSAGWILLPYESATQSGVIVDAYRFGKPVIAFAVGGVIEQVEHGVTGFLISPGDIDGFVEAIKIAASMTSSEYASFSSAAYKFGYEHYSAQSAKNALLKMLEG